MSETHVAQPVGSVNGTQPAPAIPTPRSQIAPDATPTGPLALTRSFIHKALALTVAEVQKLRHDPWDVFTRSIQPVLWLLLFGSVFSRLRVLPPDAGVQTYIDFVTPGILAQSVMTIAVFVGIMLIFERDQGPLQKYLVAPVAREALVVGKGLGAGIKGVAQAITISVLGIIMGAHLSANPLNWLGVVLFVLLGANFFSSLSLIIASLVRNRERVQGLGQIILMPLFFASNALYPLNIMPDWVAVLSQLNPLSYMVDGLRYLMIDNGPTHFGLGTDLLVLAVANVIFVVLAARLMPRVVQ